MVRLMWDRGVRDTLHDRDAKAMKLVSKVLDDIYGARKSNKYRISGSKDRFYFLLWSLRDSTRRCYDPADYVYGVLGMLQIKIPRMDDPNAVWRHLLMALDDYMKDDDDEDRSGSPSCVDRADIIDLCKAKNIGYVYKKLIEIYFGFK
ncbi:hypothetical protein O0I10_011441 [Lichtheimia ornata]|uniref:Uncharacterized protein n=1 Tax=Lichtheimia ornata TaxID=688661 RepID=A0AAD7UUK4_9FUNG|nr:uncharacterized protein O0I10_011441 [Lichtheimia ornata]KAJ8652907.1 hypothetical protein O0I10_011441 [Lichtheimia ornata]